MSKSDFCLAADENKIKIVQEGALPHIITLMRSPQDSVLIQATGCLRNLSVHRESSIPPRLKTG